MSSPPAPLAPGRMGFAHWCPGRAAVGGKDGGDLLPVNSQLGRTAVDLQPGERLAEVRSMRNGTLSARVSVHVAQPSLQGEQMMETFDVAPRQRQRSEAQRRSRRSIAAAGGRTMREWRQSERP